MCSIRVYNGEPELAIAHFEYAMRLSPFDPFVSGMWKGIAVAHLLAGRYRPTDAADRRARQLVQLGREPNVSLASARSAATPYHGGRTFSDCHSFVVQPQCMPLITGQPNTRSSIAHRTSSLAVNL